MILQMLSRLKIRTSLSRVARDLYSKCFCTSNVSKSLVVSRLSACVKVVCVCVMSQVFLVSWLFGQCVVLTHF